MGTTHFHRGLRLLAQPILPLVRLVQILFLTGPFTCIADVVAELTEPIETSSCTYDDPPKLLAPYLDLLEEFQRLKEPRPASYRIVDGTFSEIDAFEALELWIAHAIMVRELEAINTLLCGPCGCDLCCVGPSQDQQQQFFEIPLQDNETGLFDIPHFDTDESRRHSSRSEPPLMIDKEVFYATKRALYHWEKGWSMILPRHTSCPHLTTAKTCSIYPSRPDICRKPQIFSYVLERLPEHDQRTGDSVICAYQAHKKILAVWDCPYVRRFQQEIGAYSEMCDMEPIFKENKA